MVHRAASERTAITRRLILITLVFIVAAAIIFGIFNLTNSNNENLGVSSSENCSENLEALATKIDDQACNENETNSNNGTSSISANSDNISTVPESIDFSDSINTFVSSTTGANRSILIYDLDRDEVANSYNLEEDYNTASLYKLFVVYEGYRRLESGEWDKDEVLISGYTILECLDLSIRESNSTCAEALWAKIGHENLDEIVENDFNITNSSISALISNVTDIYKIMRLFYDHEDITDETLVAKMKDSFLNQPITNGYNWRQGLPSGFSASVNIYNKVGWEYNSAGRYWNIYHDTAVVEFPEENRHFIVVVMTNKVDYSIISTFGANIEKTFYEQYQEN